MNTFLRNSKIFTVVFFIVNMFLANVAFGQATVSTDLLDYPPGATAIITGSGFQAGETVTLLVEHVGEDPLGTDEQYHQPWTVIAKDDGTFESSWYVPIDGDALGATFLLTADGQTSERHAEWMFTDDASILVGGSGALPIGLSISADNAQNATLTTPTYTSLGNIVVKEGNSNSGKNDFTSAFSQITLTAPSGWQFNTAATITVGKTGSDINSVSLFSVSATSIVVSVSMTTNTSSNDDITIGGVSIISTNGASLPNSGSVSLSFVGTLENLTSPQNIILLTQTHGALKNFLVESSAGGNIPNQTTGVPFNIKVTARDQFNNTVTSFDGGSDKVVITSNATLTSGSGNTSSFTNGVLDSHSLVISPAFTAATITAANGSSGISNEFDVIGGASGNRIDEVTVDVQSGVAECGTASVVTFSITATRAASGHGTVNGTYSVTDLPAGVTSNGFSVTNFTSNGNDPFPGTTLTLNVPASLTTGFYNFIVTLSDGSDLADNEGTLIVTDNTVPSVPEDDGTTIGCIDDATEPTPPEVVDACDGVITPSGPVIGGAYTGCEGTRTYTWTYADDAGNSDTWTYTYTIEREDFTIGTTNGSSTVACISSATEPTPPSVNDNCGNAITPGGAVVGGTYDGCEGTRTYTFKYTDCEGNNHDWVYTYTIEREDFTIGTTNGSSTVACISSATEPTPPLVNDNCGNAITPGGAVVGGTYDGCEGTRTYTFKYMDCEGNNHDRVYTYTIEREDFTIGTTNGSSTVACISSATEPTPPSVNDNCGNAITPGGAVVGGTYDGCEGTRTYTFKYTDCEGNNHDWVYTYTIEREDFTIGTTNGSSTVACISSATEPTPPSVNDNCGNAITPGTAVVGGTYDGCEGTRTYTFKYMDCEGNNHDWVYTYTIEREDFTIGTTNGSSTVACISSATEPTPPSVNDNCGNAITPGGAVVGGTYDGCEGTRTYTFKYTDCEGNNHDWVYTYTIEREDFTIGTTNGSSTVACISSATEPTPPSVNDNCGNAITPGGAVVGGTYDGCEGTRTYTFKYTDCEGNNHDWVYTYTIEREDFTIGTTNGSSTVACISSATEPTPPSVNDNCGNAITPGGAVVGGTYDGCEGTRTYTFKYMDCEGNNHDWVYTYTIEREDFTIGTTNGSSTVACISSATEPTPPSVNDNCGNAITPGGAVVGGTYDGCEGTRTYTFKYMDCEGNNHDWVYTYTIEREDFTIGTTNGSSTVACISSATEPTPPSVNDNCGNAITPGGAVVGGTYDGCEGTRTYTFKYTDCEGNNHDWVYTYTIEREDFTIGTTNGSSTVACISSATEPTPPSVNDNCGNAITPGGAVVGGTYDGCEGTRTYTFKYMDCEGNNHDWVYTYTIEREDFTIGTTNGSSTVACISSATEPTPPSVNDNCGNAITPGGAVVGGTYDGCEGTRTYTFKYTDCEGNNHDWVYTYTVTKDVTYPKIESVTADKQTLWPPNHKMVDITITAVASDNCGIDDSRITAVTSNEPENGIGDGNTDSDWQIVDATHVRLRAERSGTLDGRVYTITYMVTDACGNETTSSTTVTVAHNITGPNVGNSFKIGSTVPLAGAFWDVSGNKHTATWLVDGTSVNGTIVAEPSGSKTGKVSGSFKPTVAGVYKMRMNVKDQKGVISYVTTNGDYEAYFVAYDPRGGYTYGAGAFISPKGALTARPNLTDKVTFGFTSNYVKGATNPKGETQLDLKLSDGDYSFGFNALNYDYLAVNGTKAQYKGLGKTIINGVEQSGLAFILTVIDGKTATNPNGVDKIRLKIYNKNTGAVIYDNQPGASETADPITEVDAPKADGTDIVVVSTTTITTAKTVEVDKAAIESTAFDVKAYPNPTADQFVLVVEGSSTENVQVMVFDVLGRLLKSIEKKDGEAIQFGEDLPTGSYIAKISQGAESKTVQLIKK